MSFVQWWDASEQPRHTTGPVLCTLHPRHRHWTLVTWWNMWPSGRSASMSRITRVCSRARMSAHVEGWVNGLPASQPSARAQSTGQHWALA